MTLRIFNTKSGEKEIFEPLHEGQVGMYVCGVTTYNFSHIGHGRASVVFDVVNRELRRRGYQVTYVRNYTDVDDKIIRRSHEEGISWKEVADKYVEASHDDMLALGCLAPDHEPRVTLHIPEIIAFVQRLLDNGHAYAVENGDVYYSVQSFETYGVFSRRNLEDLRAGVRVEVNELKQFPLDFALWKGARPGEPGWDAPWGKGRPGWHIECSAMCSHYLGETFDIHGGGSDLIFPHHENEIAQSEGATGRPLARTWMHNGMLTVQQEKMSKSLNNFFTIRDALQRFHREAIRLFLLSTQYRSPVDFSDSSLEEAEAGLERLYQAVAQAEADLARDRSPEAVRFRELLAAVSPIELIQSRPWARAQAPWGSPPSRWTPAEQALLAQTIEVETSFVDALDDDFNTARAIGHLFELSRGIGRFLHAQPKGGQQRAAALCAALCVLRGFAQQVLGLLTVAPPEFVSDLNRRRLQALGLEEQEITRALVQRREARACKDWAASDRIRDELSQKGIQLEDSPQGTSWRVVSRVTAAES